MPTPGEPGFSSSRPLVLPRRLTVSAIRLGSPPDCDSRVTSCRRTRQPRRAGRSPDPGSHELTKGVMFDCAFPVPGLIDLAGRVEGRSGELRVGAQAGAWKLAHTVCEIRCSNRLFVGA